MQDMCQTNKISYADWPRYTRAMGFSGGCYTLVGSEGKFIRFGTYPRETPRSFGLPSHPTARTLFRYYVPSQIKHILMQFPTEKFCEYSICCWKFSYVPPNNIRCYTTHPRENARNAIPSSGQ